MADALSHNQENRFLSSPCLYFCPCLFLNLPLYLCPNTSARPKLKEF